MALDPKQNEMARLGTTHLVPIMNDFDLLPTKNFQYGSDPGAFLIGREAYEKLFDPGFDGCWSTKWRRKPMSSQQARSPTLHGD